MFLALTVSSLIAYFVAILTPNSARSCVMQSTLPTKGMRSIISTVSISLKDFLPSIFEEEDGEWIHFLGGSSSSETKKYQGSNSSDGGNTGDGVKIAGGVIDLVMK
ncbi:hypothetical protein Tco_1398552 [Tanacetum coccineum]